MKTKYLFWLMVALIVLTIGLAVVADAKAAPTAGTESGSKLYAFPTGICSDPLLTSVTIVETCYSGAADSQIVEKKDPKVILTATPLPTDTIPTATPLPTDVPQIPPTDDDNGEEPGDDGFDDGTPEPPPAPICKNKNSGKDGTPLECNAGGGQEKNGK